jgi:nucleotidyltransferase AbiEii toxin of type IV toxin-antitoxin system
VNSEQAIIEDWTFGGGTAMMLQISHRESHDIDIFLSDAQQLGFLNPDKRDFQFEILPSEYNGDGASYLKLAFESIGEIDFIVGHAMTATPTVRRKIEGRSVLLEAVPEIIAKKIYYRGASIKPRDIFDIAAGAEQHEGEIVTALGDYKAAVTKTLQTMSKLNPTFVAASIASLAIKEEYSKVASTAFQRAKEVLLTV